MVKVGVSDYSIEIFEATADPCGSDDDVTTGVILTVDGNRDGTATVTLPLPHGPLLLGAFLGDGMGTEQIVLVLDINAGVGGGDAFAAVLPLPAIPIQVDIDIKPGSFPNSINLGSGGVIPVAILGSDAFDATAVDGSTCTLGDASVKVVGKSDKLLCTVEDVSGDFSGGPEGAPDGFLDQVCKFVTIDLGAEAGDTEATIHCSAPEVIEGTDSIRIVPPE